LRIPQAGLGIGLAFVDDHRPFTEYTGSGRRVN
jgi:hypothetical protein